MTIEKKINCQTGEVVERELTAEEENQTWDLVER